MVAANILQMSTFSQIFLDSIEIIFQLQSNYLDIIVISLHVSLSAILVSGLICVPLATVIAINDFYLKNTLMVFINSLLALPPVVVGLIIYILLSRFGLFGEYDLLYTISAMIIAQVTLISPILISLVKETMDDYHKKYKDYFISVHSSDYRKIITLIWESKINLFIHILVAFGRALSEVGAILIVGGNIENLTRTMTTGITLETSKGELAIALSLGLTLLLISLFINIILYIIKRRISTDYV
jgi:tungstate transport system permease protein